MVMRNAFENLATDASVKAIGTNPSAPLYTAPSSAGAVGQSRFRLATTGRLVLNVGGNVRAVVTNAANTDGGTAINRTVQLVRLAAFATAVGWAQLILNPTTGLPAIGTRRPKMNAIIASGSTSPITPETSDPVDMRVDVGAIGSPLGGGVDTGVVFGVPSGARVTLDLPPIVLTPGQSLGINVPFTGSADVSMSLYWIVV